MKSEFLSVDRLTDETEGSVIRTPVLLSEIAGVSIEFISVKGKKLIQDKSLTNEYFVLFSLNGSAIILTGEERHRFEEGFIVRIPYHKEFSIIVNQGSESHFLLFRKELNTFDLDGIIKKPGEHSTLYLKNFQECPVYTEDIKSSKSVNRMLLPVGLVPRFCMGSVETPGPDAVGVHEHPMLDQHFIGLKDCRCTVTAGDESFILTENVIVHIPMGSKHSVSVSDGDKLAYVWCDFFFTLKGEDYIGEQHRMDNE